MAIELHPTSVFLNEGAATRIGHTTNGETCNETHVYFEPCEVSKHVTLPDMAIEDTGRILDVCMTLKNVCPDKRVAVGISVYEVDQGGCEFARGFRAITIPAHCHPSCCDVQIPTARFILPEDLRVDGGEGLCCGPRHFIIRADSNYVDSDACTCEGGK